MCALFILFSEGKAKMTQVRMLEDFDMDKLVLNKLDGKSHGPEYKV